VTGTALWLIVLGSLGVAHSFVARASGKAVRWVFFGLQALFALNAALWGLWSLIDAFAMLEFARNFPITWTTRLAGAFVELALAALFAAGLAALVLEKDEDTKIRKVRRIAIAQALVGVVAIAVGVFSAALALGVAAP
jgi:small-conductance mechanosensitive channel